MTNWVKNLNSDLTWNQYQVESQDWYWVFKSSHDIDIEYLSESEGRYKNSTWWLIYSLINLFIISTLIMYIISKMYFFCSLFFMNHSTFSIIIFKCISLLILMSVFIVFFFMFLNISSTLISCIIILKLTSCSLAFDEISLIQKSFFFNIFLLSFVLIQNISRFNHFFIVSMFLCIDSISLMLISLAHFIMFSVVIIMILLIFSFFLMKILMLNFLQWFCTDDVTLMLKTSVTSMLSLLLRRAFSKRA